MQITGQTARQLLLPSAFAHPRLEALPCTRKRARDSDGGRWGHLEEKEGMTDRADEPRD